MFLFLKGATSKCFLRALYHPLHDKDSTKIPLASLPTPTLKFVPRYGLKLFATTVSQKSLTPAGSFNYYYSKV